MVGAPADELPGLFFKNCLHVTQKKTYMNKKDLIDELSSRLHITKKECLEYVNTNIAILAEKLSDGNEITLQGFGSFNPWPQTERPGRNPRNGKACMIRSRTSVKFKPGKQLLEKMNITPDKKNAIPSAGNY